MWQHCNRHHGPLQPGLYCGNTSLPTELLEIKEKIRDYSNFNANRFLSELQETEWSNPSDNGRFYTKDALSVWTNLGKYFVVRLGYASLV